MKPLWLALITSSALLCNLQAGVDCITYSSGNHLIAGHFDLASAPNGVIFQRPVNYVDPIIYASYQKLAGVWSPSAPLVPPSAGVVASVRPSGGVSICFSNDITPVLPLPKLAGYFLVCCQTNGPATFEAITGRSPDPGTKVLRLRPGAPDVAFNETNYFIYTFADGAWLPEAPVADTAEAVWLFQPAFLANPQISGNQFNFDTLIPMPTNATVEYSETLDETAFWSVLTNFPSYGGPTHIVDPADINVVTQRFYRLNLHN